MKKERKPRPKGIRNEIGDQIVFKPHVDGVVVFELYVSSQGSDNLFIKPKLARRIANDLIKAANWLEKNGYA